MVLVVRTTYSAATSQQEAGTDNTSRVTSGAAVGESNYTRRATSRVMLPSLRPQAHRTIQQTNFVAGALPNNVISLSRDTQLYQGTDGPYSSADTNYAVDVFKKTRCKRDDEFAYPASNSTPFVMFLNADSTRADLLPRPQYHMLVLHFRNVWKGRLLTENWRALALERTG